MVRRTPRTIAVKYCLALIPFLFLLPQQAFAATLNQADAGWMMTATALVLMMTLPGLALFYGGLVRVSNVLSILMQCFAIACAVSLLWLICGYSLAFGNGGFLNGVIGGLDQVLLAGVDSRQLHGSLPEALFVLYEMT